MESQRVRHDWATELSWTDTEYIMRNIRVDKIQAWIKIAGRNINNLRYADDSPFKAESKEELKNSLYEFERGEWKSWLKTQHLKKWRSWHPVPSHGKQVGKQCKQWQSLFSWCLKSLQMVTAAMKLKDAYSLEGKLWQSQTAYWKAETLLYQQRSI